MYILSPWRAYTDGVTPWLRELLSSERVILDDIVYGGPDGSYGVGEPSFDQMDDNNIMEMTESGTVAEWLLQLID